MTNNPASRKVGKENRDGPRGPAQEMAESHRAEEGARDLERNGLIHRLPADAGRVQDALALARRDLKTSHAILATDYDWAYTIAYNALLQAGRALMFAKGYRPAGTNQHISVVKFSGLYLDSTDALVFDRMRRKRHGSVYDLAGTIPETEARSAVKNAEDVIRKIENLLATID